MKRKDLALGVILTILLLGPFVAGPILLAHGHGVAGILVFVIPYSCLGLAAILRKRTLQKAAYRIPNAHTRFTVIPVTEHETLRDLCGNSALTFFGEPSDKGLDGLYNWLNNEGVLKEDRLNLYTYDGKMLKEVFGTKRQFGDEEKFMSIFLRDLDLNESNKLQFSRNRLTIGGRWLDDIVDNAE